MAAEQRAYEMIARAGQANGNSNSGSSGNYDADAYSDDGGFRAFLSVVLPVVAVALCVFTPIMHLVPAVALAIVMAIICCFTWMQETDDYVDPPYMATVWLSTLSCAGGVIWSIVEIIPWIAS